MFKVLITDAGVLAGANKPTVEGQKVYEDVVPHALALENQLLESLGTQERAALVSALGKLMAMDFDVSDA